MRITDLQLVMKLGREQSLAYLKVFNFNGKKDSRREGDTPVAPFLTNPSVCCAKSNILQSREESPIMRYAAWQRRKVCFRKTIRIKNEAPKCLKPQ